MKPRRYQLNKAAVAIVRGGHPWIFREQLSSAASVFRDGELLRLFDGANQVVGYGIYEAEGAIAIRVMREQPTASSLRRAIDAAIAKRESLRAHTDGIRLVHGESDGIPAVVADQFGGTLVVTSYSSGTDAYARFAARVIGGTNVVLKPAQRRRTHEEPRWLRGGTELAHFTEYGIRYAVDVTQQKTGTYLDLRGLRKSIAEAPLANARVLNLFAYTGMLGRAAEAAGAAHVTHVDQSARALDFARTHHVVDVTKHAFVEADLFERMPVEGEFDLVIVDPPAMTSRASQVPQVIAAYRKLYRAARKHVAPGGALIAACCTSRIERATFHRVVRESTGLVMERELAPEIDHPVGFPQADYLKIAWWRDAR